jgi:hypothetical protein
VLESTGCEEQLWIHLGARSVCTPVLVDGVVGAHLGSDYGQVPRPLSIR